MLKNMKVGTKLLAVLAGAGPGPADPGLRRREPAAEHGQHHPAGRAAGPDGGGERQPGPPAPARVDLLGGLHGQRRHAVEGRAGQPSARPPTRPSPTYNTTVKKVNPASESRRPGQGRRAPSTTRSATCDTQRRLGRRPRDPGPHRHQPVRRASTDLAQLDSGLAAGGQRPELARGLTTFANLNAVKAADGQRGRPVRGPRAGRPVPQDLAQRRPGGRALPRGQHSSCDVYNALNVASGDEGNAENVYFDSATADQKSLLRNAIGSTAGAAMAGVEKQIFDTVPSPTRRPTPAPPAR